MKDYQFSYDDGTMWVYNLSDTQFRGIARGIKDGKNNYIDEKNGVVIKLAFIRSIIPVPVVETPEGESFEPTYDPEIAKFIELQRHAEDMMNEPDDADYEGGRSL